MEKSVLTSDVISVMQAACSTGFVQHLRTAHSPARWLGFFQWISSFEHSEQTTASADGI